MEDLQTENTTLSEELIEELAKTYAMLIENSKADKKTFRESALELSLRLKETGILREKDKTQSPYFWIRDNTRCGDTNSLPSRKDIFIQQAYAHSYVSALNEIVGWRRFSTVSERANLQELVGRPTIRKSDPRYND